MNAVAVAQLYSPAFGLHHRGSGGHRALLQPPLHAVKELACPLRVLVVASCPLSAATLVHHCEVHYYNPRHTLASALLRPSCTTARSLALW